MLEVAVGILGDEETVACLLPWGSGGVEEGPAGGGVVDEGGRALGYLVEVRGGEDGAAGAGGEGGGGEGERGGEGGEEGEDGEGEGGAGEEVHCLEVLGRRVGLVKWFDAG